MAAKDDLGRAGEHRAAQHLEALGYTVVDRNWRTRGGELDIVATSDDQLVVVEVKTRSTAGFGHPLEAITTEKRARLWRLAFAWIAAHPDEIQGRRLRIDAIGLTGPDPQTAVLEHATEIA
jgi:putative endonuclease